MTLFTSQQCVLCNQLKKKFDLVAMQVNVEILDTGNADALAHLAWHELVEAARKTLPILVMDDCSTVEDFPKIEKLLLARANKRGISCRNAHDRLFSCDSGSCSLH